MTRILPVFITIFLIPINLPLIVMLILNSFKTQNKRAPVIGTDIGAQMQIKTKNINISPQIPFKILKLNGYFSSSP